MFLMSEVPLYLAASRVASPCRLCGWPVSAAGASPPPPLLWQVGRDGGGGLWVAASLVAAPSQLRAVMVLQPSKLRALVAAPSQLRALRTITAEGSLVAEASQLRAVMVISAEILALFSGQGCVAPNPPPSPASDWLVGGKVPDAGQVVAT